MNKDIIINNKKYKVQNDEFNKIVIEEFCNLNIIKNLDIFERLISLIKELTLIFNKQINITFYNITHGGFIPINCADVFKNVFIFNDTSEYNENIISNIYLNSIQNISIYNEDNKFLTDIIFADNLSEIKNLNYQCSIILTNDSEIILDYKYKYKLINTFYILYIPEHLYDNFYREFKYFIEDNILNYDNLIHMTMIVKNAGDNFKNILKENLSIIDRWTILDTGSTDNTIDIINKFLVDKKKGKLYQEPFINFRDSRNRCLDLAGRECKFCIMLDDTYIVKENLRDFLNIVRGDQFSDSFSLFIKSNDNVYNSNRIIKSESNLRYIHKIHEVISHMNNKNIIIPLKNAHIFDYRSDYMENRTINRKEYDLKILFEEYDEDPTDPRNLYYIAQTYNIMEKYDLAFEYYLKRVEHPTEGFIQEKINACFEAARMTNFKLNKPWELCEELYLKSYKMDETRGDALYFLGIHYYLEKNYEIAYKYMKKCFELGYPEHCQYSLKPSLHFYFLPKFLSELCYIFKDYITGKIASDLFLEKTKIINNVIPFPECYNETDIKTIKSWNNIFNYLVHIPVINTKFIFNSNKPYFIFMADGGFTNWSGKDILTKGVGGAETFTIEIARYIQKSGIFQVVVFCRCDENNNFEGVEYIRLEEYFSFIFSNNIHTCIIGRYSEYYPITLESKVQNIYMIAHDLEFTGNVIPLSDKLKKIFCLSKWHCEYFTQIFPTLKDIIEPFGYGIDIKLIKNIETIKNEKLNFIYSSFPIRGLLPLLQMWPKILNKYPNAILNIHSDIDGEWSNKMRPNEIQKIKEILKLYKNNSIIYHGWTSKKDLIKSWLEADIWFYPCTYQETFCHTAFEAAISKTFIITNHLAALRDTVGDRGYILKYGDFYDENYQNQIIHDVFKAIDNTKLREELIQKNYAYVEKLSWENRAETLLKDYILNVDNIIENIDNRLNYMGMYNWTNNIPLNSYNQFLQILDYIKWKNAQKIINILEIGTYTGTSIIKFLELLPNSQATVIDIWKNYNENNLEILFNIEENNTEQIFYKNIENANMKNRIKIYKGESATILLNDIGKFDFIYVDGSHKLLDLHLDLILSFNILNKGGIMGIDDYLYNKENILESPYEGVNHFLEKYKNKIKILSKEYRIFIEKI